MGSVILLRQLSGGDFPQAFWITWNKNIGNNGNVAITTDGRTVLWHVRFKPNIPKGIVIPRVLFKCWIRKTGSKLIKMLCYCFSIPGTYLNSSNRHCKLVSYCQKCVQVQNRLKRVCVGNKLQKEKIKSYVGVKITFVPFDLPYSVKTSARSLPYELRHRFTHV